MHSLRRAGCHQAANSLTGFLGAAVLEFLADKGLSVPVLRIGIGDCFVEQGTRKELLELCGMTPERIARRVKEKYSLCTR